MWAVWARWFSVAVVALLAVIAVEGVLLLNAVRDMDRSVDRLPRSMVLSGVSGCGTADDPCIVQPHRGGFRVEVGD